MRNRIVQKIEMWFWSFFFFFFQFSFFLCEPYKNNNIPASIVGYMYILFFALVFSSTSSFVLRCSLLLSTNSIKASGELFLRGLCQTSNQKYSVFCWPIRRLSRTAPTITPCRVRVCHRTTQTHAWRSTHLNEHPQKIPNSVLLLNAASHVFGRLNEKLFGDHIIMYFFFRPFCSVFVVLYV